MGTGTLANLLDGTGVLYTGPTGESLPELDNLAPPLITVTPGGNWVAVGFSEQENHELDIEAEWENRYVSEHLGPVKAVCVREGGMFKIKFAEQDMTALNTGLSSRTTLATQAAAADVTAQDHLKFGDKATTTQKALLYLDTNPESGSRIIHIPYAVATENVAFIKNLKGEGYDVGWTILCDPTATAGERMLFIYDLTAAASS